MARLPSNHGYCSVPPLGWSLKPVLSPIDHQTTKPVLSLGVFLRVKMLFYSLWKRLTYQHEFLVGAGPHFFPVRRRTPPPDIVPSQDHFPLDVFIWFGCDGRSEQSQIRHRRQGCSSVTIQLIGQWASQPTRLIGDYEPMKRKEWHWFIYEVIIYNKYRHSDIVSPQ